MDHATSGVTRRRLIQGAAALFGMIGTSRAGFAASPEQDARAAVTRLVERILQAIHADAGDRHLVAAIEGETNLSLLARMTLGRYWRSASNQQRKVFSNVFRRYLLHSFTSRLRRYAGTSLGEAHERFTILTTKKAGKNDVVVRSVIKPPSGAPLRVDWRLRARDDRLFIIDLVVEGVSLLITQRSEFSSVVERIGIDGLIGELQTRVARQI